MNYGRILLGGLLAGVWMNLSEFVLNGLILMDDYQAVMADTGLEEAGWAMPGYILGALALGLLVAWLYAALRPRFGAGWKTGAIAGAAVWVGAYAVPSVWFGAMGLGMGAGPTVLSLVWGVAELMVAGVLAGWLYREGVGAAPPAEATGM